MWKPPQRIKFHSHLGQPPSAEQAQASRLFSPVSLGPLTLSQRTWVPAMVRSSVAKPRTLPVWRILVCSTPQSTLPRLNQRSMA